MNLFAGVKVIFVINPYLLPTDNMNFVEKQFAKRKGYYDVVLEYINKKSKEIKKP